MQKNLQNLRETIKNPELSEVRITTEKESRQMNIELKKSLSILELGDLAKIIEMQEKDI